MDPIATELVHSIVLRLAACAGIVDAQQRVRPILGALLEPFDPADSTPRNEVTSMLTAGNYPVELGLIVDGGRLVGLKHTLDLCPDRAPGASEGAARRSKGEVLTTACAVLPGTPAGSAVAEFVDRVSQAASAAPRSIYLSTTYLGARPPSTKVYLVGEPGAYGEAVIRSVANATTPDVSVQPVLGAMEAWGKDSVDTIGFGIGASPVAQCKYYLVTPHLHAGFVRRLADALDLPVGTALALMRWYRLFVGPVWGRVGACGVGLSLREGNSRAGLEAYTFPSRHHIAEMAQTIDRSWSRGAAAGMDDRSGATLLGRLLATPSGCTAASLYLAGCGVELAPFARLGRGTIYFGVRRRQDSSSSRMKSGTVQLSHPMVSSYSGSAPDSHGSCITQRNVTTV